MKLRATVASCIALAACGDHPAVPSHAAGPALATVPVAAADSAAVRPVEGVVEAVEDALLAAQTSGRVTAVVHDVGDRVAAGAVLLKITGVEQRAGLRAAEGAVTGSRSALGEASAHYERVKALYDEHIASKAQYEAALAGRDAAAAASAAADGALANAREGVAYTEIRAPFSGVVSRRVVEVGETVAPGRPLLAVVSPKNLRVAFSVPASIAEAVRHADAATVQVGGRSLPLNHLTVFPEAGGDTGTFRARVNLPAGTDIAPGTPVRVELPTGTAPQLSVPTAAIVHRSEVTAVYVVDPKGAIALRYVRTGHSAGDRTEVLSGLDAGEAIATDIAAASRRVSGTTP